MTYPLATPPLIETPFGSGAGSGYITNGGVLPTPSQISITPGAASLVDGFPPLNYQEPLSQGGSGVPPAGQDLTAILYMLSAHIQNLNAGVRYQFNATLAAAIGGYPIGAILQNSAGTAEYINILAYNTTPPNSSSIGVSWLTYSSATSLIPAGTIIQFSGTSAPACYLACPNNNTASAYPTGNLVSRTTYNLLFSAIGTTWGAGDGLTTFGLPWFVAGYAGVSGTPGTVTVGQVINHIHAPSSGEFLVGPNPANIFSGTGSNGSVSYTGNPLDPISHNPSGGISNLAAGTNLLMCVKY